MKLKNINIFEQHAEKAVLGVGVLFFLVCLVLYVLMGDITDNIGGKQLTGDEADRAIKEKAQVLEHNLDEGPVPGSLKQVRNNLPDYNAQYTEEQLGTLAPTGANGSTDSMVAANIMTGSSLDIGAGGTEIIERPYRMVELPPVEHIRVNAGMGTIDAAQLVQGASGQRIELINIIGTEPPYDLRWVTVGGRIEVAKIIEQHAQTAPSDMQAVPATFWMALSAIADLEVERQERLPDGTWGDTVIVKPMPDRVSFREVIESGQVTRAALPSLVAQLKTSQKELVRPIFYPMQEGRWRPPDIPPVERPKDTGLLIVQPDPGEDVVEYTREDLKKFQEEALRIQKRLTPLRKRASQLIENNRPVPPRMRKQIKDMTDQLRELVEKINAAKSQLGDEVIDDQFGGDALAGDTRNPFGANNIAVWINDLYVEPGKTYRYRMRGVFINPMFGWKMPAQQAEVGEMLVRKGAWSAWTEPVETPATMYYFLAGANKPGRAGKVKVWKFFNGAYQTAEFTVEPGDVIGGVAEPQPLFGNHPGQAAPIDFGTGAVVVDFDFDYRLKGGLGGGLTERTTRLIAIDENGNRIEMLELHDRKRVTELTEKLNPRAGEIDPELLRELNIPTDDGPDRRRIDDGFEDDDVLEDDFG